MQLIRLTKANSLLSGGSNYPLIGLDDPPPVTIVNEGGSAKALFTGDHASNAIPKAMNRLGLDDWVLSQHVAWDIGTKNLILGLSEKLDAPAVMAGYSRLLIDCNRSTEDPTAIPEISDYIPIPGNAHLTEEAIQLRVQCFYQPYRKAIEAVLDTYRSRDVAPALISIHSFTPELAGVPRPWHVGVLWDVDPRIPVPLLEKLRARPELRVGDNQPYSGRHPADFTIDHHAEAAGLPHVSIEVRQDLIDSDQGVDRWAEILGDALGEILADPKLYSLWHK